MPTLPMICDAHVHIYPQYDIHAAFENSLHNFRTIIRDKNLPETTIPVWLLTEGQNYNFESQLPELQGYRMEKSAEKESQIVFSVTSDKPLLYILAGRQLVTSDNLEVCALGTKAILPDRKLNTKDTIEWVLQQGGVPALNWAPGKWFFARGQVVRTIIESFTPEQLLISETTMRPTCWSTPVLMKAAMNKGLKILAGSDPLPLPGEEKLIGSYASVLYGDLDPDYPAKSIKALLLNAGTVLQRAGKRSGPFMFAKRQFGIMRYNKSRKK